MTPRRVWRAVLLTIAATGLLGTLVFLFVRTQSIDVKAGAHALSLLREMKDIDARWDLEALRLADDAAAGADPLAAAPAGTGRGAMLDRAMQELERGPGREAIADALPELKAALAQKREAFAALAGARDAEALRRFSFLTFGMRLELASHTMSRSLEAALDEKDRWRIYLAAYAAALLVGIGYLASRVVAAQRALRQANEGLERRVAERTAELTDAMARLKESEAQLVQTEKMSSLGQLVAGVAHEINTPLAYVKNSVAHMRDRIPQLSNALDNSQALLAMLQSDSPGADELQAAFDALSLELRQLSDHRVLADLDTLTRDGLHGIEQISELVANLRNFSRLDRSKVASFDVNESVRATFLLARPLLRNIDVEKRLGELPSITCSPSQVNQVLLNLVTNAAQAMDKPRPALSICTRRDGPHHVAIEVQDNGRGIAPENLARIFDPFFTTKPVGKGTGLGLSIAYKIVDQHGGRIDVRSTPGEGSTFTVVLPVSPPAERQGAALEAAAA